MSETSDLLQKYLDALRQNRDLMREIEVKERELRESSGFVVLCEAEMKKLVGVGIPKKVFVVGCVAIIIDHKEGIATYEVQP